MDSLSNFVESTLDASGDLYLKYFFADGSRTTGYSNIGGRPGTFSLDQYILPSKDQEAIGLPFSILPNRELSIKKDHHPWSPKPGATFDDHIAFAKSYSPGHIVAITPDTKLTGGSVDSIKQNGGRFAVVKITDLRLRDHYKLHPEEIPRQVSPGFINYEYPNSTNIKNFKWAHLAAVPRGAYGDKATIYASCLGGNECINNLVGASVAELDEQLKHSYCPIGASENISSLATFETNSPLDMSVNATTAEPSTTPATPAVSTTAPVATPPKGAPITTGTQPKGVVRLKTANNSPVTPNSNAEQQPADDSAKLREEVEQLKAFQQQIERREQIKRLIPKELFINKGRFDEKAFETEVESRLKSGQSDEAITEYYTLKTEHQKLLSTFPELQKNGLPQIENSLQAPTPTGGSNYQTSSDVPMGGSATATDRDSYVSKNINQLLSRVFRSEA